MLRLSVLCPLMVLVASAVARPQTGATWSAPSDGHAAGSVARGALSAQQFVAPPFQRGFQPVVRQGRRIAAPDDTQTNLLSSTTTTPASKSKDDTGKKLVTLKPIGNNIQEILYNNGYRKTPGEKEPETNNIDDYDNLDGLEPEEVWLLDEDLLVLKGGSLKEGFIDTTPIDDFEAPYREPKFPPPGFNPQGILPPGSAGTYFSDGRGHISKTPQRQPEGFIPEFGYDPYGTYNGFGGGNTGSFGRSGVAQQPGPRAVLPPPGFSFGGTTAAAPKPTAAPEVPKHTHTQVTYVKKNLGRLPAPFPQPSSGYITSYDSLPRSFVSGAQYPASAASAQPARLAQPDGSQLFAAEPPASTLYNQNGNYMTYTNHDGGFSYSYKTDGL